MSNTSNSTNFLRNLVELLQLESIGANKFRGRSQDLGFPNLFGGQVLAQALKAASYTVESKFAPHSLHAYFLRAGNAQDSVEFEVDCIRDGKSFLTRRIVASQKGIPILNMSSSWQIQEKGFEHQLPFPENVPKPDDVPSEAEMLQKIEHKLPQRLKSQFFSQRPFEFRYVNPIDPTHPVKKPPFHHVWFRAVDSTPSDLEDDLVHPTLLAYVSDLGLLFTALRPHKVSFLQGNVMLASIDHAMWFHRPFRIDEWLLYSMNSPNASNARGFCLGHVFQQDGTLVASVSQEGLMRPLSIPQKDQQQ